MTAPATAHQVPRPGMFAIVRNRRGVIAAVEPRDDAKYGRLHLVHVEYKDDQWPPDEQLLWEREAFTRLLEPNALPDPSWEPMNGQDFDAVVRATRWTAASPFVDPDGQGPLDRLPISSPFHGAVQVEDFQLVPLLKALAMPRVNLLIADDVGLGKTVEAGLILTELLLRRRIQRVLILTPASLRNQWRDEMWDKFALTFETVDRAETFRLRQRMGMDANPWRAFNRIIASYYYLRQPDVLEQFRAASQVPEGSPHLPWDLLIVDEAHNLMPSPFGRDSDLCETLRQIAPLFEHRIFLSATPHNGHTRSFSGLLEILDPVRFSQSTELNPAEKQRVPQVVIRRLKREINERTSPPRFCHRRPPEPIAITLSEPEAALVQAFSGFRQALYRLIAEGGALRRQAGTFAVEILKKRLLSCPTAFAESWWRCKEGLAETDPASDADVDSARRAVEREQGNDAEVQARESTAASVVGAWLKKVAGDLRDEIAAIDSALERLGLGNGNNPIESDPVADARFDALVATIDRLLRDGGRWRRDERLVVFTEYKTTLDYLTRRLRRRYPEPDECILTLYGGGADGMDQADRDRVKAAFNDPEHPVRVLVATDAAAEGLNLQGTARYLLHFDLPWNPSRLEQRNGRIDRHGQARDVTIHYFLTDQDEDLAFLAHVVRKANEIREDLGSINELFDEAAHRRLVKGEDAAAVQAELDRRIDNAIGRAAFEADTTIVTADLGRAADERLAALAAELDLTPGTLRDTLESALAIRAGRPQLVCDENRTCRLLNPGLQGWRDVIDETVRRQTHAGVLGSLRRLAFEVEPFLKQVGERLVFQPNPDVLLLHLSHPMMQRALSLLTRRRFPGAGDDVSRWTVRYGDVPADADALVLLTLEELAVNELRETFHHWVRTLSFPIRQCRLGPMMPHVPAVELARGLADVPVSESDVARARALFEDVEPDLRSVVDAHAASVTDALRARLQTDGKAARAREDERYRSRQGEVSTLINQTTIARLEREIAELQAEKQKGWLFDESNRLEELGRSIEEKQQEIERRRRHYEEVREQLERERERILKYLLPRRYAMAGTAQVFPVAVEIRLPHPEGRR